MSIVQTVKIAVEATAENLLGYVTINLEDFDAKIHKLFGLSEEAAKLKADAAQAAQDLEDKAKAEAAQVAAEAAAVQAKLEKEAEEAAALVAAEAAAKVAQDAKDAIAEELAKALAASGQGEQPPAAPATAPWITPAA